MSEEAAVLLDAAADEIDKNGWTQGYRGSIDGPKCAWGAVIFAHTGDLTITMTKRTRDNDMILTECWDAMAKDLQPRTGHGGTTLVSYNDYHAPEKRYVTRALRRVARKMRAAL